MLYKAAPFYQLKGSPSAQVIIILGAKVYANGKMSPMMLDRVETALYLYSQGKADTILVSGDHGQVGYDEVNTIKDYLLENGVPGEHIFLDHAGFDTYDSLYRAQAIFQIKSAIIVTQEFHLPRAIYIGRALGLDVSGVIADRQPYQGIIYNQLREIPARLKSFVRVQLHSQPRYLGEPIPITGSSFESWDEPASNQDENVSAILQGARADISVTTEYDPSYYVGGYPPAGKGVCTDVIAKGLKNAGYDLKTLVDADIKKHPSEYGLDQQTIDPNIDYRRVANLLVFFKKYAQVLANDGDWQGGDIVIYEDSPLTSGMHIAVVSDKKTWYGVPLVIHNYGIGTVEDNLLHLWPAPIVGHFRYPKMKTL